MGKYMSTLLLSLLCTTHLFAGADSCFRRYLVKFTNRSGGIADVQRTSGITGASHSTELGNNESVQLLIQKRGAEIEVKAGPEGNKTNRGVTFYSKDFRAPQPDVTLNPRGVATVGFSQKPITFNVKIDNQSGGTARIINSCETSPSGGTLADGKSIGLTVKPSSFIIVEAGPENQKIKSKIIFAEQTGQSPRVILEKRGFISRGIQHRDLDILGQRIPIKHIPLKRFIRKRLGDEICLIQKQPAKKVKQYKKRSPKALKKEL